MKCLINNVYFNESVDKTTMAVGNRRRTRKLVNSRLARCSKIDKKC